MKRIAAKKSGKAEKVTAIVFFVLFLCIALICIYPLLWSFNNSLKLFDNYTDYTSHHLTKDWRFINYINVFTKFESGNVYYPKLLLNSVLFVVVKVFVNVASSTMLAYALARFRFPGKELLYSIVIFVNTIPIIGSGPAAYKLLNSLNMVENPLTIWVSWAAAFDFAFIVLYGYFKGISSAYSESAYIDGAGELRVLFSIILPQVVPCVVAIMITQATSAWNDYGTIMIYLRESMPTLAYAIYKFDTGGSMFLEESMPIVFAATVISSIPIIVLYACTQKLILTNMTAGGLKG